MTALHRVLFLLVFSTTMAAARAPSSPNIGFTTGPFVQFQDLYALYLYPAAPELQDGHIYVPLQSTARLMGMTASPEASAPAVTWEGHTWRPGLGVTRRLHDQTFVQLRPWLDAFGLEYVWLPTQGTLRITDDRALPALPNTAPILTPRTLFDQAFAPVTFHARSDALIEQFSWRWMNDVPHPASPGITSFDLKNDGNAYALSVSAPSVRAQALQVSLQVVTFSGVSQARGDILLPVPEGKGVRSDCVVTIARVRCAGALGNDRRSAVWYVLLRAWTAAP